ncbi:MAG: hypothetical protein AB4368_13995 [Xenococcaceae cyanobacterium]
MNKQGLFVIFEFFSFELEKVTLLFGKLKKKLLRFKNSQPEIQKNKTFQKLRQELSKKGQVLKELYFSFQTLKKFLISQQDLHAQTNNLEKMFQKYGWQKEREIKSYFQAITRSLLEIDKKLDLLYDSFCLLPKFSSTVERNLSSQFIRFVPVRVTSH